MGTLMSRCAELLWYLMDRQQKCMVVTRTTCAIPVRRTTQTCPGQTLSDSHSRVGMVGSHTCGGSCAPLPNPCRACRPWPQGEWRPCHWLSY